MTYEVPAGDHRRSSSAGSRRAGAYDVAIRRAGGAAEVTVSPGSAHHADQAGVLAIGTFAGAGSP